MQHERIRDVGPLMIAEKSTGIMQAVWKVDVELQSIMISPTLFERFTINEIKFNHRSFTAAERAEMDPIDERCKAFVKKFYEDHHMPFCDKCHSYGCSESCKATRATPPPSIPEDEVRAFNAEARKMREPWFTYFKRIETIVFEGAESRDALTRSFPNGKRDVHGLVVPNGHCITFSVSNFTRTPHDFVAHIDSRRRSS